QECTREWFAPRARLEVRAFGTGWYKPHQYRAAEFPAVLRVPDACNVASFRRTRRGSSGFLLPSSRLHLSLRDRTYHAAAGTRRDRAVRGLPIKFRSEER